MKLKIKTNYDENLTKQITVKLTETQYNDIREMALENNRKVSDLMRIIIVSQIEQMKKTKGM